MYKARNFISLFTIVKNTRSRGIAIGGSELDSIFMSTLNLFIEQLTIVNYGAPRWQRGYASDCRLDQGSSNLPLGSER